MSREYEDEGMKVREKPVETKVIRDDEVKEAPLEVEESVQKTAARTETIRHPLTDQEYGDTMREEIEQVLGPVMDTFKDIKPGEIRADYAVAGIRTYQDFKQFGVSDELLRRIGIVKERERSSELENRANKEEGTGISKSLNVTKSITRDVLEWTQKIYLRPTYERMQRILRSGEELAIDIAASTVVPHVVIGAFTSLGVGVWWGIRNISPSPAEEAFAFVPMGILTILPIATNLVSGAYEYLRNKYRKVR